MATELPAAEGNCVWGVWAWQSADAAHLAVRLVGASIAGVEADEVLQAVAICHTRRQLQLAALQQAGAHLRMHSAACSDTI